MEILEETLKGTLQYLDCIICDRVQIHLMFTESSNHTKKSSMSYFFRLLPKKVLGLLVDNFNFDTLNDAKPQIIPNKRVHVQQAGK